MLQKIAVVGAGNVGATAAQRLAEKQLARTVIMIDVVEGVPQGKGLDQWESAPIEGFDTRVVGANGYDEAKGAEVFVVTAGIARKPGMSRDDLVKTNARKLLAYYRARYRFRGAIAASATEHRDIAKLILNRDPVGAEERMQRHVQFDQVTAMDLLAALS